MESTFINLACNVNCLQLFCSSASVQLFTVSSSVNNNTYDSWKSKFAVCFAAMFLALLLLVQYTVLLRWGPKRVHQVWVRGVQMPPLAAECFPCALPYQPTGKRSPGATRCVRCYTRRSGFSLVAAEPRHHPHRLVDGASRGHASILPAYGRATMVATSPTLRIDGSPNPLDPQV